MIQAPGRLDSIVARRSCPWEFFSSLLDLLAGELTELKVEDFDIPLLGFDGNALTSISFGIEESVFPILSDADRSPFQHITFTVHAIGQPPLVRECHRAR